MFPFPYLPPGLAATLLAELCACLPLPLDNSKAGRDARDVMAMAAVAALDAADAAEAMFAIQVVAAEAHARECLRQAMLHQDDDRAHAVKCRTLAASMMRGAQAGLRALRDLQATRPIPAPPVEAPVEADAPEQQAESDHGFRLAMAPPTEAHRVPPDPAKLEAFRSAQAVRLGLPRFASAWVQVKDKHGRLIRDDVSLYDPLRHGRADRGGSAARRPAMA